MDAKYFYMNDEFKKIIGKVWSRVRVGDRFMINI